MPLGTLDRTPPPFFRQGPSALSKLTVCAALALFLMVADTPFGVTLPLPAGNADAMRRRAEEIRSIRDAKYPPSMRCAGSIFKNLLVSELPEHVAAALPPGVVIEGKLPAGWLLDQVGAKGMRRGDIQVAAYHANTIYNDGAGKSEDLRALIEELKVRVRERFGIQLEEEVQYVGF